MLDKLGEDKIGRVQMIDIQILDIVRHSTVINQTCTVF